MTQIEYLVGGIKKETIGIPNKWADVSWARYVEFEKAKSGTIIKRVSILSGVAEEDLLSDPFLCVSVLNISLFAFSGGLEYYEGRMKPEHKIQIETAEWGKLEAAKMELKKHGGNILEAVSGVVKVYTGIEINEIPATEAIGVASFFLPN